MGAIPKTDYARLGHEWRAHHERYKRHVAEHGVRCQDCGGAGGYREVIDPWIGGPWMPCDWCEGTGLLTTWLRGAWLRERAAEKRLRAASHA